MREKWRWDVKWENERMRDWNTERKDEKEKWNGKSENEEIKHSET